MANSQETPPNIERRYCGDHSGVTAQQTLVLWLLGILISLVVSVVGLMGLQYKGISSIDKQVAIIPVQLDFLAKRQQDLTEDIGELGQRVHDLETRTEGMDNKQHNVTPTVKNKPVTDKHWWDK